MAQAKNPPLKQRKRSAVENYVRESLLQGYTRPEIKQSLLTVGWSDKDINDILLHLTLKRVGKALTSYNVPLPKLGLEAAESYIVSQLARKVERLVVEGKLEEAGWSKVDVARAFSRLQKNKPR